MINMINAIPEELGWALVGFTAAFCLMMMVKLGKLFVQMWKERHEDEETEYSCEG